ncbi:MAG TPA: acid phosphatase [Burkholderiaceae bacterium]|nr:acid phosphatase [Burkholderiaceae bacterium]
MARHVHRCLGKRFGLHDAVAFGALLAGCSTQPAAPPAEAVDVTLARIEHVVVIYGENRSFDNLYGDFPGANGLAQASATSKTQLDLDGRPLPVLPPVWSGPSGKADPAFAHDLPNAPFALDAAPLNLPLSVPTPDLVHRYYQSIEQIDGGRNDRFVAFSDAGALTMAHYDGSKLALWRLAREYTLADNFFMGTFGGSYMNHIWFACACVARFADAPEALKSKLGADGKLLRRADSPDTVVRGPVRWERDGALTPDGYAVNTIQSFYQPSGIPPAVGGDTRFADRSKFPLPPIDEPTIGDRLTDRGVSWIWYSGGWNQAVADSAQTGSASRGVIYTNRPHSVDFQPHHQPYNYFRRYAPGTRLREQHIKDGEQLLTDIEHNTLPQVSFYKPVGDYTEHSGYTDVASGDAHIASIIEKIRNSPAWNSTLIIVTYDENGGYWDHVAPPSGPGWSDRWGPGTRIPAILISPFVRKGFVDHTTYDTTSIHRFLARRFHLEPLPSAREKMGDLTNALALP